MESLLISHTGWPFPFTPEDWEYTPSAVQAYLRTMHDELGQLQARVETLEARLTQNSTTSHWPPSSDSPKASASPSDRHHASESWWKTGPSGPSPGAVAPHDRARVSA